ncbi:MAG: amidohydrolase family protein [Planctomycetales bacterium]|nr:amidohydrolase family protein [Planctomycetales bacterium]
MHRAAPYLLWLCGLCLSNEYAWAQTVEPELGPPPLTLSDYQPIPKLVVPETLLDRAAFPVVDVHSHFFHRLRHDPVQLDAFVRLMDRNQIAVCVSLDGKLGGQLSDHIDYLWTRYRERFVIFANVNWQGTAQPEDFANWDCHQEDFAHRTVLALQDAKSRGVSGVKVFKSFGLSYKNPDGSLIAIDDPRFYPIWNACGQLGLPVIMHTGDPSAFFDPIDVNNERYEELSRHPDWHFPADKFPPRAELHAARNRLFARFPNTTFIAAHLGNDGEDLAEAGRILQEYPNVMIEFASRISELGRQPYTARDFLIEFQDRVMFGTDGPWPEKRYQSYWRFLETRDQYFPYSEKEVPPQGLWRIYGIDLPDDVLKKIYYENASRVIPGVQERLEQFFSAGHDR